MSRRIAIFIIPALVAVCSYFWYKRRSKKGSPLAIHPASPVDTNPEIQLVKSSSGDVPQSETKPPPPEDTFQATVTETEEEDTEDLDHCTECAKNQRGICKRKKAKSPKARSSKIVRWNSSEDSVDSSFDSSESCTRVSSKCTRDMGSRRRKAIKSKVEQRKDVSVSAGGDKVTDVVSHSISSEVSRAMQSLSITEETCIYTSDKFVANDTAGSSYGSASHSPAEDMLGSPTASDALSEGSSDSGKGGSDVQSTLGGSLDLAIVGSSPSPPPNTDCTIYEFEIPQKLCPRLIGRYGCFVNEIKSKSGATVLVKQHPSLNAKLKLVAVEGTLVEVDSALDLIRERFPERKFPQVTLERIGSGLPRLPSITIPDIMMLQLPAGICSDVILSSMVTAGHFFLQQPTHPSYPQLGHLEYCMTECYAKSDTPTIPHPLEVGVICCAPVLEGWYRAQVVNVIHESNEVDVKFLDHGGYSRILASTVRQIRSDFMALPFQASECYLANVLPKNECEGWSVEACAVFEELSQGVVLQAQVVALADDGIPFVYLFRVDGLQTLFVNRELMNRGVGVWAEVQC